MNKKINRREFLKTSLVFIGGALLLPITKLFSPLSKMQKNSAINPREAKYYSSGKNLAG